jgi:hypothetical protein
MDLRGCGMKPARAVKNRINEIKWVNTCRRGLNCMEALGTD